MAEVCGPSEKSKGIMDWKQLTLSLSSFQCHFGGPGIPPVTKDHSGWYS